MANKSFYGYFKENMEALGLQAPVGLFGSLTLAIASIKAILAEVDKFGPAVTVSELVVAGTCLEGLGFLGACTAALYVGACIGSLDVAGAKTISDWCAQSKAMSTAHRYGLTRPWLVPVYHRCPGILSASTGSRGYNKLVMV